LLLSESFSPLIPAEGRELDSIPRSWSLSFAVPTSPPPLFPFQILMRLPEERASLPLQNVFFLQASSIFLLDGRSCQRILVFFVLSWLLYRLSTPPILPSSFRLPQFFNPPPFFLLSRFLRIKFRSLLTSVFFPSILFFADPDSSR